MADRSALTAQMMRDGETMTGPVANAAFEPGPDATAAQRGFAGTLHVDETALTSDCAALNEPTLLGGDPRLFPGVSIGFTTQDGALIPDSRGLRRSGGDSYWDLAAGAGQVWSEPGDGGLSRASFPFQLSNERENETHNGLASFLFDDTTVTPLAVQKITHTQPDHMPNAFQLWGRVPIRVETGEPATSEAARQDYTADRSEEFAIRPIDELAAHCGHDLIEALAEGPGADSEIVAGLVIGDVIYATPMRTEHGAAPFPRAMRFGLWSATKAAFGTTALMRLAHHLGPDIGNTLVGDVVEVAAAHDGWLHVTIRDCLNMASGIGTASPTRDVLDIHADNLTGPEHIGTEGEACYRAYQAWYAAKSRNDKLAAAFACPSYPWGPGEVTRYRDQDLFMAGVAMDAVWKRHRGPDADLFAMVADEVYQPIGIRGADMNRTLESGGALGVPVTAFGFFLGLDDIAKLGRLLHDGGMHDGEQLLDPSLVREALDPSPDKGLPTGHTTTDGDITYHLAYWMQGYNSRERGFMRLATMRGYGGNIIQPLPNGMTAFRLAHDTPDADERYDALKLARIADAVRPL
ncbi:MAG: hypothetical protein AAF563_20955 [Pseudomonadota bacterium]